MSDITQREESFFVRNITYLRLCNVVEYQEKVFTKRRHSKHRIITESSLKKDVKTLVCWYCRNSKLQLSFYGLDLCTPLLTEKTSNDTIVGNDFFFISYYLYIIAA